MNAAGKVIFVCEHGSARSVVAAAHFNRLAAARGLALQAVARGTHPDERIAPSAAAGLQADGLVPGEPRPAMLSKAEAGEAAFVVSFCALPEEYDRLAPAEQWNDIPAVSADYARARDAILVRLGPLLDKLQAGS